MSGKHNPNVVIPDQLPNENDIERLFPKCPPKQVMFTRKSNRQINKRKINQTNNNKASNQANVTTVPPTNRKQLKSKVHQHSRRELEARRNRISSSSPVEKSSTSSDENNYNNNSYKLQNLNKSLNYSAGDLDGLHKTNSSGRKSSKYTASQSLLQQLKRSQSSSNNTVVSQKLSYSNNNNDNNNETQVSSQNDSLVRQNINNNDLSIVSIENHTSQQLLILDSVENDVIRNDASMEELCSNTTTTTTATITTTTTTMSSATSNIQDSLNFPVSDINFDNKPLVHRTSFDTLSSVDESAEINMDQYSAHNNSQTIDKTDIIDQDNNSNMRASKQSNIMNRGFVPPGYTQRIKIQSKSEPIKNNNNNNIQSNITTEIQNNCEIDKQISEQKINIDSVVGGGDGRLGINQKVKFDNDNLISIKNDTSSNSYIEKRQRIEHIGQMPIINEAHTEYELETVMEDNSAVIEKDLSDNMNKMNLNNISLSNNSIVNSNGDANLKPITRNNNIKSRDNVLLPTRSSSLQFNTLSDNDSGNEESSNQQSSTLTNRDYITSVINKCDSKMVNNRLSTSNSRLDEDMTPTTKTALIFPILDEGLSSEAESCEDDVEEDDERAMEGDVDADDDEDDDDDDDDEDDDDIDDKCDPQSIQISSSQSRVDSFITRQPHIKSQSYNQGNTNQQHMSNMPDQNDTNHSKPSSSNYSDFTSQDQMDHNNLKSIHNNYSNQNGQSSYWVNPPSHQTNLSSQPTSNSQQFNDQLRNNNSNNNNNSISKTNSFNRDEGK